MGGRRPKRISAIAGSSKGVIKFTKELNKAIQNKDVDKTLNAAFKIASTNQAINNFANAMSLLGPLHNRLKEIEKGQKILSDEKRHEIAVKEWSKIEKEKNLELDSGLRRMIIEAAKKALRGDRKWKIK